MCAVLVRIFLFFPVDLLTVLLLWRAPVRRRRWHLRLLLV